MDKRTQDLIAVAFRCARAMTEMLVYWERTGYGSIFSDTVRQQRDNLDTALAEFRIPEELSPRSGAEELTELVAQARHLIDVVDSQEAGNDCGSQFEDTVERLRALVGGD